MPPRKLFARFFGVLLIAVVLASGVAGRSLAEAHALGSGSDARGSRAQGLAVARAADSLKSWRPISQDVEEECDVRGIVESPAEGAPPVSGPVSITGWAADLTAAAGTGISA